MSTHVLDAARGRPAAGVAVRLERRAADGWELLADGQTNADGRLADWGAAPDPQSGTHRLVFATGPYLEAADGQPAFFPEVAITFQVADPGQHYHVPLLLSPFAYSTYRGS